MLTRLQGASLLLLLFMVPAAAPAQDANPVADARAIVTDGTCRFTILTPRLLRLEWAADWVFEDHASLVFLNRQMTVPPFTVSVSKDTLLIRTSALEIRFLKGSGRLAADNLEIRFSLNGVPHSWRPGTADLGNLKGTIRTLDGVEGATPLEPGLVSRDGWAVVDDGARPLFDASPWAWVMPRPSGERQDLYFFGYGLAFADCLREGKRPKGCSRQAFSAHRKCVGLDDENADQPAQTPADDFPKQPLETTDLSKQRRMQEDRAHRDEERRPGRKRIPRNFRVHRAF